ncbi:hypothetical protein K491DRAFT_720564 [Lophiostoma macrostomum CBS 122681]|uniref:Uncharacterized protein n=1 Tax=Lophiostoma macrostomum CBS 122681 TaxID=1314788 RepID=A0A6A6SUI8_9PLEO|nr:hypothetical protein K491DRAFT_720564 [Lophiostoma macrostomum CBS 122681]
MASASDSIATVSNDPIETLVPDGIEPWIPYPNEMYDLIPPRELYTRLHIDYPSNRWLCPGKCRKILEEQNPNHIKHLYLESFVVVDTPKKRAIIMRQNTQAYEEVRAGKDVAYFANPPTNDQCARCSYDRVTFFPPLQPGTPYDPNNPDHLKSLQAMMDYRDMKRRHAKLKDELDIDVPWPTFWKGDWGCWACAILISPKFPENIKKIQDSIDNVAPRYLMTKNRRERLCRTQLPMMRDGVVADFAVFINVFNPKPLDGCPLTNGLTCRNQHPGHDIRDGYVPCGAEFGVWPVWWKPLDRFVVRTVDLLDVEEPGVKRDEEKYPIPKNRFNVKNILKPPAGQPEE